MNNKYKYRLTKQRSLILEELQKAENHPTADQIYRSVRKRLPRISLGTIYRNLEALLQQGIISKIIIEDYPSRFEFKKEEHLHIRCVSCDRIDDLPYKPDFPLDKAQLMSDYEVIGYNQEFIGKCPRCLKQIRKQEVNNNSVDEQ